MTDSERSNDDVGRRTTRRQVLATTTAASIAGLAGCSDRLLGNDNTENGATATALVPKRRFDRARELRSQLGEQIPTEQVSHSTNGDEEFFDGVVATFGKGLPHTDLGEPEPEAYETLVAALDGETPFEEIPLGKGKPLVNPEAALDFVTCGADPPQFATPPAPAFESPEAAGEMVELYWKALARDVPFREYDESALIADAKAELASLDGYAEQTPTDDLRYLFTANHPDAQRGPWVSQFLYRDIPRGQHVNNQRFEQQVPDVDYITDYDEWLSVQRGERGLAGTEQYRDTARYITTGRDLATYVHGNTPYQMFLSAGLIMLGDGVPLDPGNPFASERTQSSFIDLGLISILGEVGGILQPVQRFNWYSKWMVHRRLRPEAFGGRVHNDRTGKASYPFHETLRSAEAVDRVESEYGTALLPQAYPEGCPAHPSYPAGHAGIAGACGGVLKTVFDMDATMNTVVRPTLDGQELERLDATLPVEGEINKLQFNNTIGRNWAGIHYRSDGIDGIVLGERVAAAHLNAKVAVMERDGIELTLPTVDGQELTVDGNLSRSYTMPDPDSY